MGMFGKLGKWVGDRWGDGPSMKGLKSSVKGTGKLAAKAAPYVAPALALTGVGAPLAAAIAAGVSTTGNLAAGKNIGESLKSGVKTGVTSYAGAKGVGAIKNTIAEHGVKGAISQLPAAAKAEAMRVAGRVASGKPAISMPSTPGIAGGPGAPGAEGGAGGVDWGKLLGMAGTAYAGYEGVKASNEAGDQKRALLAQAIALANEQAAAGREMMAEAKPIRQASSGALHDSITAGPQAGPNLAAFAADPANPYGNRFARPALPAPVGDAVSKGVAGSDESLKRLRTRARAQANIHAQLAGAFA